MSRISDFGGSLYRGDVSIDFVGRRRQWYAMSAVLLLIALSSLVWKGLNFGIEFEGGSVFAVPSATCTVETARDAFATTDVTTAEPIVTEVSGSSARSIRVQTLALNPEQTNLVATTLADACQVSVDTVSTQVIGPSWGGEITKKAFTGLGVFLLAIVVYLSITFEWRMAAAALVALVHDVVITVGIYALVGFEVTPASVIGVLTILGYSLYDTVVVFDKVKENTRGLTGGSRMTYSDAANLAVNQTLVRSINTSVVGLLPVAALLFVGAYVLGAGTLKDLALALFVGIAVGTYSSIFVATPFLAELKEREPAMQALSKRVAARRASRDVATQPAAAVAAGSGVASGGPAAEPGGPRPSPSARSGGPRNQPKRSKSARKRRPKR
ncbi:MAG: protein translocase subunit SecF [Actinomycetota bacterium]|nr:protein translocase subunit SecF [Actinomycetota bacterium]